MNYKITTKKGLEKKWEKVVNKNTKDAYSKAIIKVTKKVCDELDKDKSPEKAERIGIKNSDITGFMAGAMASMIRHFHPRGEEFNNWWNGQFGVKNKKGTVNPALITINSK